MRILNRKKLKELIHEASALKGILYEGINQLNLILRKIDELLEGKDEQSQT
jgi:hypothetical protein